MLSTIQAASIRSGLSAHVIRIWERRYAALTPTRTGTNRRMYCDAEIERLRVLRELTENGHRIGNIASLEVDQLVQLMTQVIARPRPTLRPPGPAKAEETPDSPRTARSTATALPENETDFVNQCMGATKSYNMDMLRRLLNQARVQFGQRCMIHRVICPLIHQVVKSWREGDMKPSHEHIATAVIREILMTPTLGSQVAPSAPEVMISTPAGEVHELGALLLAASARELGWRVTYLGLNLPTEDIVACARARQARAVALSLVDPDRCPDLENTLRQMRAQMPAGMALLVGGCTAAGYAEKLKDEAYIYWAHDLCGLDQLLVKLSAAA